MIRNGIPHSMRSHVWMRVSGALEKRNKSPTTYKDIVKASSNDLLMTSKQIEKVMSAMLVEWEARNGRCSNPGTAWRDI